ncbi:hypothetical protein IFM89_022657 [Coptis chinensis]|uniref:Uncharacterized protein n=1 Tax=Coptis chinensis TaxID=261450 RepID=A0A835LN51_9MAGN|nr:hypothetical protein IFM89_022657 [Coptis chinensis]
MRMMESQLSLVDIQEEDSCCTEKLLSSGGPRRKKRGCYNLRKSMAWNNAFLTEQGVLNPQELSRIVGLSGISEEEEATKPEDLEGKLFRNSPKHVKKTENAPSKRLPSFNLTSAPTKDVKIPKYSASKPEQSSVSTTIPKVAAPGAKHPSRSLNRPAGKLEKNGVPRGSSGTSKATTSCVASMTRSSVQSSGENMEKSLSVRKFSTKLHPPQASKAITGLKVNLNIVPSVEKDTPTFDASTSKVIAPLPQNAHYCGGQFSNALFQPTKPSGFMPCLLNSLSFILLYLMPHENFNSLTTFMPIILKPLSSTPLTIKSPRNTETCTLHEVSTPSLKKFRGSHHTGDMKSVHELCGAVTVNEGDLKAMKCLIPSMLPKETSAATANSHSSLKSSLEDTLIEVEVLNFDCQSNILQQLHSVDGNVSEQCDRQAAVSNPAYHEDECIPYEENRRLQDNANKFLAQSGSSLQLQVHNPSRNSIISGPENIGSEGSALEIVEASPCVNSEILIYGVDGANNSIVHQHGEEAQELSNGDIFIDIDNRKAVGACVVVCHEVNSQSEQIIPDEVEKVQHRESSISEENSGMLVEQNRTPKESTEGNDIENSRGNGSDSHIFVKETETAVVSDSNISGSELECKLDNAVLITSCEKLQKDESSDNFIDLPPEDEEKCGTNELEISEVPLLIDSEIQSYGVFGADSFIEHKKGGELQRSLKSNAVVDDIDDTKSVNKCFEMCNEVNIQSREPEELREPILDEVKNHHEENYIPQNNICGLVEQENTFENSLEDNDLVNSRGKELKNIISSKHTETTDLFQSKVSNGEQRCELVDVEFPERDEAAVVPLKGISLEDSKHDTLTLKPKLNAAPFSDEWLAALEEVGEEILTKKTGAVQNSPPDKSLPEPGPWSPVKRKNIQQIGPYDCTKYTNLPPP